MRLLAAALLLFVSMAAGCGKSHLEVNDRLPDFKFFDTENRPVEIYELLAPGKLLFIHFWGAGCCLEYSIPTLNAVAEISQSNTHSHVTVVSVNLDYPQQKVQAILKEQCISLRVLNDPEDTFYKAEPGLKNAFPLAYFLVVDDQGIIQNKMMGPQLVPAINDILTDPYTRR